MIRQYLFQTAEAGIGPGPMRHRSWGVVKTPAPQGPDRRPPARLPERPPFCSESLFFTPQLHICPPRSISIKKFNFLPFSQGNS